MIRLALALTLTCAALPALAQAVLPYNGFGAGTLQGQTFSEFNGNQVPAYGNYGQQQNCVSTQYGNQTYTTCR